MSRQVSKLLSCELESTNDDKTEDHESFAYDKKVLDKSADIAPEEEFLNSTSQRSNTTKNLDFSMMNETQLRKLTQHTNEYSDMTKK